MERAKRNQENISSVRSVQPVKKNTLKSNISLLKLTARGLTLAGYLVWRDEVAVPKSNPLILAFYFLLQLSISV